MNKGLKVLFLDFESLFINKIKYPLTDKIIFINTLIKKLDVYVVLLHKEHIETERYFSKADAMGLTNERLLDTLKTENDCAMQSIKEYLSTSKRNILEYFIIIPYPLDPKTLINQTSNVYYCLNDLSSFEIKNCLKQFEEVLVNSEEQNLMSKVKVEPKKLKNKSENFKKAEKYFNDFEKESTVTQTQLEQAQDLLSSYDFKIQARYKSKSDLYTDMFTILSKSFNKLSKKDIDSLLIRNGIITPVRFNLYFLIPFFTIISTLILVFGHFSILFKIILLLFVYLGLDAISFYFYHKNPVKTLPSK